MANAHVADEFFETVMRRVAWWKSDTLAQESASRAILHAADKAKGTALPEGSGQGPNADPTAHLALDRMTRNLRHAWP